MTTLNGGSQVCRGVSVIEARMSIGTSAKIDALVVEQKPLDFDMLLGYDAIQLLGGALITLGGDVQFQEGASVCAAVEIDQPDFSVKFNAEEKYWTASWKWTDDKEPPELKNNIAEYHVQKRVRPE